MKNKYIIDQEQYAKFARRTAAEGIVMLKNDNGALPLIDNEKISIFGRIQLSYYKSGTGSGGLVNTRYVVSILDALLNEPGIEVNKELLEIYRNWEKENPFDEGNGWAQEPFSQKEMPLSDQIVRDAAKASDKAVVILGRSAGEDKDSANEEGSYLLNPDEEDMLAKVCQEFEHVIVLLNVGNIMDMSWVEKYNPSAVLYVWQGGMEGGNGVCDVLTGKVSPSGHLTDTIAREIEDYPSTAYFGDDVSDNYAEDIYVGYRYFETFAKDKVLYPFGFGLSYTIFENKCDSLKFDGNKVLIKMSTKNVGSAKGKNVLQVYVKAPQGKLGRPARELIGFKKSSELNPGETETLNFEITKDVFATYDDSGKTGFQHSYVLEPGNYEIYVGENVREAELVGSFEIGALTLLKKVQSALAPTVGYKRFIPEIKGDDYQVGWEETPLRNYDLKQRMAEEKLPEYEYTGNFGYKLGDVYDHKISMAAFLGQLTDEDLRCIVRGEGMCSARVAPGTASAFGGVTDRLEEFGIPAGCCADGPSGIRMDCGTYAFSIPSGTCIGCTFDERLTEELFEFLGAELRKNRVDTLLGPGMNIHRNPLNGRNFEYVSEDPLVTGKIAAAELRGLHKYEVTGTIKHFACNNQEHHRRSVNANVSERALREIYLKGFEIAVKEGNAYSIMTSYNGLNGIWTSSSYDLTTTLLRNEWGFEGIVMTDWWAAMNEEGEEPDTANFAAMVKAQNDLYMVVKDAKLNESRDNLKEAMEKGEVTRGQLQRCAINILKVLMRSPVMARSLGRISQEEQEAIDSLPKEDQEVLNLHYQPMDVVLEIEPESIDTSKGSTALIGVESSHIGEYEVHMTVVVDAMDLAQVPITFYANGINCGTETLRGTGGQKIEISHKIGIFGNKNCYVKLFFGQSGVQIKKMAIVLAKELTGTIWE